MKITVRYLYFDKNNYNDNIYLFYNILAIQFLLIYYKLQQK